jgi:hypothetical protein
VASETLAALHHFVKIPWVLFSFYIKVLLRLRWRPSSSPLRLVDSMGELRHGPARESSARGQCGRAPSGAGAGAGAGELKAGAARATSGRARRRRSPVNGGLRRVASAGGALRAQRRVHGGPLLQRHPGTDLQRWLPVTCSGRLGGGSWGPGAGQGWGR